MFYDIVRSQKVDKIGDEGAALLLQAWAWERLGEGEQSPAFAGGQDHRLHAAVSSSASRRD